MIGDFLNWIGRQDPVHVFYGFSVLLFTLTFHSYRVIGR